MFFSSNLIIDKNMRNIYKLIHTFFEYTIFFPALPYTSHNATPDFIGFASYLQKIQSSFFPFLFFDFINLSRKTFINAYKLYFYLVNNVYIAHENVELVPVLSSVFYLLFIFLKTEYKVEHQ